MWWMILFLLMLAIAFLLWLRGKQERDWRLELTYLGRHSAETNSLSDVSREEHQNNKLEIVQIAPNITSVREQVKEQQISQAVQEQVYEQMRAINPRVKTNSVLSEEDKARLSSEEMLAELPIFASIVTPNEEDKSNIDVPHEQPPAHQTVVNEGKERSNQLIEHEDSVAKSHRSDLEVITLEEATRKVATRTAKPKRKLAPVELSPLFAAKLAINQTSQTQRDQHNDSLSLDKDTSTKSSKKPEVIDTEDVRANLLRQKLAKRRNKVNPEKEVHAALPLQVIAEEEVFGNLAKTDSPVVREKFKRPTVRESVIPAAARIKHNHGIQVASGDHPSSLPVTTQPISTRFTPFLDEIQLPVGHSENLIHNQASSTAQSVASAKEPDNTINLCDEIEVQNLASSMQQDSIEYGAMKDASQSDYDTILAMEGDVLVENQWPNSGSISRAVDPVPAKPAWVSITSYNQKSADIPTTNHANNQYELDEIDLDILLTHPPEVPDASLHQTGVQVDQKLKNISKLGTPAEEKPVDAYNHHQASNDGNLAQSTNMIHTPSIRQIVEPSIAPIGIDITDPLSTELGNDFPFVIEETLENSDTTSAMVPQTSVSSPTIDSMTQEWHLPTLSLLQPPQYDDTAKQSDEALLENSITIEEKLAEFKVKVNVVDAYSGPVITRYEIEPAQGVRGSQVVNLEKDLARSLGFASIRVVETIPGKTCMGLELPNPKRQTIRLSEIFSSPDFEQSRSKLTLALGQDITGQPVVTDLAKAPHLLVAGTTGSGKSVGVNAMILSMLFKATPEEVRLIMIDPKMLELSIYEGIPHLLAPVVTDMKLAANALTWCVNEMEKRYRLMSHLGVRNLAGYNQKINEAKQQGNRISNPFSLNPSNPELLEKLPFIVVVVDEFADLMMTAGKKIEELIARLAQKARAAGIHLILATQRPSVDVITGLIKANIPTRIAFQVSSKVDSRTILDQMGAENLLGQGDMLFLPPGTGYPRRVHGAFVADEEVHGVVEYLKQFGEPNYVDDILTAGVGEDDLFSNANTARNNDADEDPLYDEAVSIVIKTRKASISSVQRQLRIGYNRAARLVEQMEADGIVSAPEGNGNRTVLAPNNTHLDE